MFWWEKIRSEYLALIYEKLCGQNWAKAEESLSKSPDLGLAFDKLLRLVENRPTGFSATLRREYEQSIGGVRHNSTWYVELANKYHVCTDPTLSAFAFSLAMKAHRVPEIFETNLDKLLVAVRGNPAVLRGARFLECTASLARQL